MEERGKFIVIEGGDGSGKGTVLGAIKRLEIAQDATFTREPGGSPLSEKIRNVILSRDAENSRALTLFALFWAARADHMEQVVEPTLNRGKHIISDRFDASTFAYQIYAQENLELVPLFWNMRDVYCKIVPDLYIYLCVDVEEGLRRAASRGGTNHFDEKDLQYHHRVQEGYNVFLNDERVVSRSMTHIVDANRSPDEVSCEVVSLVEGVL